MDENGTLTALPPVLLTRFFSSARKEAADYNFNGTVVNSQYGLGPHKGEKQAQHHMHCQVRRLQF